MTQRDNFIEQIHRLESLIAVAGMLVATIVGIAFPPAYFAMFSRKGQER